jgi:hypothetical protein
MAYGNLVRNYFVCNAQSALLDPSLVKIELSTKEALAYAALLSYWGCNTITPTWDALLNRSRLGKTALSAALDSLEVKQALERRRFTDRTGRRHVIYFLNIEVLFEQDVIEACGMEDDLYKHSIKEGASDSAVLARVSHLNTTGWKSTRFTTKQVKESLTPEEDRSCDYDEDSLDGFLISGFPDEEPAEETVEETAEENAVCQEMRPLFGDGADLEDDAPSAHEASSGSSGLWPETAEVPGGSNLVPTDVEDASTVSATPAAGESIQERAERIVRDHAGDDVIDAEIIDVEIVEDETPSDALIDVPVSQELTIATPAVPVKAKKPSGYTDDFENFWRTYPRRIEKKSAFKAWKTALKSGATADEITAGAARYAKYRAGEPERFTKHPSTWLNQGCWEDEYSTAGISYGYNGYSSGGIVARTPEDAEYFRNLDAACTEMYYKSHGFRTAEEFIEYQRGIAALNARQAEEDYAEAAANRIPF